MAVRRDVDLRSESKIHQNHAEVDYPFTVRMILSPD